MRRAALAGPLVALGACSSLLAPLPSPSPSAVTRATPRPDRTLQPVAAPRPSATPPPSASPSPSARPAASSGPRPTLGLRVVNAQCAKWPDDARVLAAMTQLLLPPSLCLLRATASAAGTLTCTVVGCVAISTSCVQNGSCIQVMDGENPHYVLVLVRPPEGLPPEHAEDYTLTRYLCLLHQERTLIDADLRGRSWLTTLEGREFSSAFATFVGTYPEAAREWGTRPSDVDNYADVCAGWYYPQVPKLRVDAYPPLAKFAEKWLPK